MVVLLESVAGKAVIIEFPRVVLSRVGGLCVLERGQETRADTRFLCIVCRSQDRRREVRKKRDIRAGKVLYTSLLVVCSFAVRRTVRLSSLWGGTCLSLAV